MPYLILYAIYLYTISRLLAYGGCVHSGSGSQNQAVLTKRHDYISVFYFGPNKNNDNKNNNS